MIERGDGEAHLHQSAFCQRDKQVEIAQNERRFGDDADRMARPVEDFQDFPGER
jgi:hypothetical protein